MEVDLLDKKIIALIFMFKLITNLVHGGIDSLNYYSKSNSFKKFSLKT
jgi:hypothetical protein